MSNLKKSLDDMTADIRERQKNNDALQQAAWREVDALQQTQRDLLRAYIKEARLLNLCTWNLDSGGNNNVVLYSKEDSSHSNVKELAMYVETDYHSSFGLVTKPYKNSPEQQRDVVTLRFDDGEIRIIVEDPAYVVNFIKEYGLKIHTNSIDAKMEVLQDALIELQTLKEQITEE